MAILKKIKELPAGLNYLNPLRSLQKDGRFDITLNNFNSISLYKKYWINMLPENIKTSWSNTYNSIFVYNPEDSSLTGFLRAEHDVYLLRISMKNNRLDLLSWALGRLKIKIKTNGDKIQSMLMDGKKLSTISNGGFKITAGHPLEVVATSKCDFEKEDKLSEIFDRLPGNQKYHDGMNWKLVKDNISMWYLKFRGIDLELAKRNMGKWSATTIDLKKLSLSDIFGKTLQLVVKSKKDVFATFDLTNSVVINSEASAITGKPLQQGAGLLICKTKSRKENKTIIMPLLDDEYLYSSCEEFDALREHNNECCKLKSNILVYVKLIDKETLQITKLSMLKLELRFVKDLFSGLKVRRYII